VRFTIAIRSLIFGKDSDKYFKEVEDKLIEETDYLLELKQSLKLPAKKIENLVFPEYYPEFSSEKIITMDWMTEYIFRILQKQYKSKQLIHTSAMGLYMYQIHILKKFTQIHILVTFLVKL
jgi:predicted unusual protein kinase regulating ubiquinone biosynthesis (AarF/ABC1/UbiB family)